MKMVAKKILGHFLNKFRLGSYETRLKYGALPRNWYAHLVYEAARLAKRLGHERITVLEFGVAGGRGILNLEYHAREVEKIFGITIDIVGFDATGLPEPQGYKDLPYQWQKGFYAMDHEKLAVRTNARLILGDVKDTVPAFLVTVTAPIGAVAFDLDYYSSTVPALQVLSRAHCLPRVFCYFDDILGDADALFSDYHGVRLAMREFNEAHEMAKLSPAYYLLQRPSEPWHHKIYIAHLFDHPDYNTFIGKRDQHLKIV